MNINNAYIKDIYLKCNKYVNVLFIDGGNFKYYKKQRPKQNEIKEKEGLFSFISD